VLVQDPAEAEFTGMPNSALVAASRARTVSVRRLAREIRDSLHAVHSRHSNRRAYEARMGADMDMIESDDPAFLREDESRLTRLTCPDCGGGMEEQTSVLRYLQQGNRDLEAISAHSDQAATPQDSYVNEVANRAEALRSQVRAWSTNPPQLDAPAE
jgi:hypothetical protein